MVSCSVKPQLLSEMPSPRAGEDTLVGALQCHCVAPGPREIAGWFVLHLRGEKKKKKGFSGRVGTKALQGLCPVSKATTAGQSPGAG